MDLTQVLKLQAISKSTLYSRFNLLLILSCLHKCLHKFHKVKKLIIKKLKERRRPESAGAASATINQTQLSLTDQPVAYCLLLLLILIQPAPLTDQSELILNAVSAGFIQWGGGGEILSKPQLKTYLNIIKL